MHVTLEEDLNEDDVDLEDIYCWCCGRILLEGEVAYCALCDYHECEVDAPQCPPRGVLC